MINTQKSPAILTITANNNPIVLQTQPSALSMKLSTSTHNVRGIDSLITFIGPPEATDSTIEIT